MKQILGKNLLQRKVVSQSGTELGEVKDADFEMNGKMISLLVKPENISNKAIQSMIGSDGLIAIPFDKVMSIGKYIIVNISD